MHPNSDLNKDMAAHFSHIISSSPDAILSVSMEGLITSWNNSAEQLFGYTAEEIVGKPFHVLTDASSATHQQSAPASVPKGDYRDHHATRLHKDGRHIPVTITGSLLKDHVGEVVGRAEFLRDGHGTFTAKTRKHTEADFEEVARHSQLFTSRVLDSLFAFVAIYAPDGTIVEINRAPLEAAGVTSADVIGKKMWDNHWCNYSAVVQSQIIAAHADAIAGKTVRFDLPIRMLGTEIMCIDFQLAPLRGDDGTITHLVGSGVDLTDRKRAEDQLRQNYLTYLSLIQNAPFGIFLIDCNFRIAQISAGAKNVFANVTPLIGRSFAEALHIIWAEPYANEAEARFRHTLATGDSYRAPNTSQPRADIGIAESYDWQIERVVLPGGTFGIVCYFYDLTERLQHEEQVRQLMYEISHRSKNLLGVVQSIARQTIASNPGDFMGRFSERLQSLSWNQDLLIANDWRGVKLIDLVRAQLATFDALIGERIHVSGPPVQLLSATAQGIGMALHELTTNAGKYGALSNETGCVSIAWGLDATEFVIHWSERGGPTVAPPERRGFGYSVISKLVEASVAGKVTLNFETTGLTWSLRCPAANVVETRWVS
jgi:PAS domain S-box-containing protein